MKRELNINELIDPADIDLSSFKVKDELNTEVWENDKLNTEVRERLLEIATDFWESMDIDWADVKDITLTGSLANFNWSKFSDVDLHILVNYADVDDNVDLVLDYFGAKKTIWNDTHDITIHDFDVEVYIQNTEEEHASTGVYSIQNDEWIAKPKKEDRVIDEKNISKKASQLMDNIDDIEEDLNDEQFDTVIDRSDKLKEKIRNMRRSGLEKGGEYSVENLAFKVLRRNEYLNKLADMQDKAYDAKMTIE